MADATLSLNRNRTIFIFVVALIALVLAFLGTLYFSGQRGAQLRRLATTDQLRTDIIDKKPVGPKKETPKKKDTPQSGTTDNKKATKPPTTAKPAQPKPKTPVPQDEASGKPIPATGPTNSWMAIPALLVVGYLIFEYRRSRQAIQRAAFHENSAF